MPQPLLGGLPPGMILEAGSIIRVTALDPTSGATVTGISLANVSLLVRNMTGGADETLQSGPFLLVPGPAA